jgi:antitoxin component HigA of HigAB toxin-antitoxin module
MAALLSEEGRFPAVQEISKPEYDHFVQVCQSAPEPIQKLRDLMKSQGKAK